MPALLLEAAACLGGLAFLAALFSLPLAPHFSTHYLAAGGDYDVFVWNIWYFRHALTHGLSLFWSDYVYWPYGANLILHHYTLSHDAIAYVLQPLVGLTRTYNLLYLGGVVAGGLGVFLWLRRWGAAFAASFAAGACYAFSPVTLLAFHSGTSLDNLSLHVIPFFVWALANAAERRSLGSMGLVALALSWVWTCNYYYFMMCLLLTALVYLLWERPLSVTVERRAPGALAPVLNVLVAALGAFVLYRIAQGQRQFHGQGGARQLIVYVLPYVAFWGALGLRLLASWRLRVSLDLRALGLKALAPYAGSLAVWAALNAPLIVTSLYLMRTGDYGTTPSPWRGGGNPVDPVWGLLPHPWHPVWGGLIQRLFDSGVIGNVPGAPPNSSLGLLPLAAAWWLWRRRPKDRFVRLWFAGFAFSLVLNMGPWLKLLGVHLYLPLPFYFIHLLPLFNNLQQGIQFNKFISMFLALVFGAALTEYGKARPGRARWAPWAALALLAAEFAHTGAPLRTAEVPPIWERLRSQPYGAILPVPVGATFNGVSAQGYLGRGWLPERFQAVHEKPMVGGVLGRVSRRSYDQMRSDPFFQTLVEAQDSGRIPAAFKNPKWVAAQLSRLDIGYVAVDASITPAPLAKVIETAWGLERLDREGDIRLFSVP
ncbi:MAG: hypothetical protein HY553_04615 [Elusimicrobia bacterium]|nr:hypothetical protein [Elusimicrobiota bacterium]